MKKIKVTDKNGTIEYINDGEVINRLHLMGHGLPERIVEAIEGSYNPADVLEEFEELVSECVEEVLDENGEVLVPATPAVFKSMVKLKAEYSIEIDDISFEYELNEVITKRKSEYPTMEEFLNAYFDGGEAAILELQQKRLEVKAKYPKPIKEQ